MINGSALSDEGNTDRGNSGRIPRTYRKGKCVLSIVLLEEVALYVVLVCISVF